MVLEILYFAWVREQIGIASETVEPPVEVTEVGRLVVWLATRSPAHAIALAEPERLRAAVDQRFVSFDASLDDAREVAIFPPVTGG